MILEDYLKSIGNRLGQHADDANASIVAAHNDPNLASIAGAFKDSVLGTALGLPLEAANTFARGATGAVIQAGNAYGHMVGVEQTPQQTAEDNAIAAARQGHSFLGGLLATNENVAGISPTNAKITGAGNALFDPSNFVDAPIAGILQARKATRLGAIAANGAEVSPELIQAGVDAKNAVGQAAMRDERHAFSKAADAAIAYAKDKTLNNTALDKLANDEVAGQDWTANAADIGTKYRNAKEARLAAQADAKDAPLIFRATQAAKKQAVDDLKAALQPGEKLPNKAINDAKEKVVAGYTGLPAPGENFKQYVGKHHQLANQLLNEEQGYADQLRAMLNGGGQPRSTLNGGEVSNLLGDAADAQTPLRGGIPKFDTAGNPIRSKQVGGSLPGVNDMFNDGTIASQNFQAAPEGDLTGLVHPETGEAIAAAAPNHNDTKVMALAVQLGRTPSAAEIQREMGVGMVEASRLQDVASGKTQLGGAAQAVSPTPNVAPTSIAAEAPQPAEPLKQKIQAITDTNAIDGTNPTNEPGYYSRVMDLFKTAATQYQEAKTHAAALKGLTVYAYGEGVAAQKIAMKSPMKMPTFSDVASLWKGQLTQNPRNIFLDEVYARMIGADQGLANREITRRQQDIVARLEAGETNPILLFGDVSDDLLRLGRTELVDEKNAAEFVRRMGTGIFDAEYDAGRQLNALVQMGVGAGFNMLNPVRATTSLLTAPLGYLAPMRQRMFHIINNVTQTATRAEAFRQAFRPFVDNSAEALLKQAESEGLDTSVLRGIQTNDATADGFKGLFSHEDVTKALGERFGNEWDRMTQQAANAGFARATEVYGNFNRAARGPVESFIDKFAPFMSWSWRAYPRVGRMVLEHPAVVAGILQLEKADRQAAQKEGRPGYQYGTLAIHSDTPLLGQLLKIFTPEQENEVRFNPLSLFSPVGGEALSFGSDGAQQPENMYQQLDQLAGLAGASPNPLIQTGAYIAGADYKAPSPASRYNALDQLTNDVTGGAAEVPTIQGLLDKLRGAVTGQVVSAYDPVDAKAKELIYERTGMPVSDPRNQAIAQELAAKGGIYKEARLALDVGGSARTLTNANSPISITTNTETKQQQREATKGTPFTYEEIQQAKTTHPELVQAMQAVNQQYLINNPAAAIGKDANLPKQQDPRLDAWDMLPHNQMLRRQLPQEYNKQKAAYAKALGIK